jgi:hypothetical protein
VAAVTVVVVLPPPRPQGVEANMVTDIVKVSKSITIGTSMSMMKLLVVGVSPKGTSLTTLKS